VKNYFVRGAINLLMNWMNILRVLRMLEYRLRHMFVRKKEPTILPMVIFFVRIVILKQGCHPNQHHKDGYARNQQIRTNRYLVLTFKIIGMAKEKFRIGIIDFMPEYKKVEVGKYEDGTPACLGDVVKYNGEDNWFIAYRYGSVMLKQVGTMAMVGQKEFQTGDFSRVEKTNVFGAGPDWLIIGYTDEPMYERIKHINNLELIPATVS
jgi:hypothetical protein